MSNHQVVNNNNNDEQQPPPPWLSANLLCTNYIAGSVEVRGEALKKSILPGPFTILQGSPGDGMANTLDSMPMLPIESMLHSNNNNGGGGEVESNGRRRSSVNSSLHPLEEVADEEEEEECSNLNEDIVAGGINNDSTSTTIGGGRERSDSLTGGGLHYPLGEKSPIMQRRMRSLSLTSTLMQQQRQRQSASSTAASLHQQNIEGRADSSSLQFPFGENDDDDDEEDHGNNDVYAPPLLKRRQQNISSSISSPSNDNNNQPTTTATAIRHQRRRHAKVSKASSSSSSAIMSTATQKSTAEIESMHKWQNEVSQQEHSHLEERNQNVKLLLDRRKRSQERMRLQQQQQQHQLSVIASAAAAVAEDGGDDDGGGNNRSGSPVALATATSASSSSSTSSSGAGSNDYGSGSATSGSRSSSPVAALSSFTPQTITVTPIIEGGGGEGGGGEEEDNFINHYMNSLELEMSHRSWYQKDGRLVVFQSLPYMAQSGKVVVHPLLYEKEEEVVGREEQLLQLQERREEEDEIITLAPGTTVMAEEAISLDSRSLKILHSTATDAEKDEGNDNDQRKQQQQQRQQHGHNESTLVFLNISTPYPGYILSHVHNYPYLAPGIPTTYTNSTWLWRVTCQPDGAFIRSGLDLITNHIGTLPYGTLCCVKKKVVNYMGLNRLEIDAFVSNSNGGGGVNKVSGYISEFLNPLSGQRGNIVEEVPFPQPAIYKVIHAEGAIIRSGVELSTGQIGFAPMGSILCIVGRSYSSNPSNNCIERLKLAGGGGWISVNLNREDSEQLVVMIGVVESFDPEDPASFHFEQQKKVMEELKADDKGGASKGGGGGGNNYLPSRRSTANLSEIGEDDQMSIPDSSEGNCGVAMMNDARAGILSSPSRQSSAAAVPTLFQRSGVVGGMMGGLVAMDAVRESSSDNHQNDNANRCLICLSE